MQIIKRGWSVILIFFLTCSYTCMVGAATTNGPTVSIELTDIVVKQASEGSGDEVYVSVTEYSSLGTNAQYRIPMFPNHWLSQRLDKVKNQALWRGVIAKDQAVELIISLLEHDVPPWNVDDHVGSVKVIIANRGGKLSTEWGEADFVSSETATRIDDAQPRFKLQGNQSEYIVGFKLITH